MKGLLVLFFFFFSVSVTAELKKYCDDIKRFRIWPGGSDTYGIWVEFEPNPAACPGGFYIPNNANNKALTLSFLMAEKAQNNKVCVQAHLSNMEGNRCRLNYAYNP